MQLGMQRIIQFSSRLTQRRYDTCAIRLVAPASNEPYIQYRACKIKKLNKHNISNSICPIVISNADNHGVDRKVHRNAGRNVRFGECDSIAASGPPPGEVTTCSKGYISLSMSNDETRIGS